MSKKLIEMVVVRKLILLLQRGLSERNIARELSISRATVRRYLQRIPAEATLESLLSLEDEALAAVVYPAEKVEAEDVRLKDFESRKDYFLQQLPRTGVTRQLLWMEYKRACPDGFQYSKFCSLLATEQRIGQATMANLEHRPADMVQVDFAGEPLFYFDSSGSQVFCPVFVAVLPYSGYSYICALPNASLEQVVKALNLCLEYFGGVPFSVKSDNLKQVVTKPSLYEPSFTQMMDQWSVHNRTALLAARVRKPKDKPHVEGGVQLAYLRGYAPLRDQVFRSLAELNTAILKQLEEHHHKPFQKRNYTRYERFISQEKAALQPLAATPYAMKHYTQAKVQKNYHIILGEDWHHYSVPYRFIGQRVKVIYDADWVEVYLNLERIALHRRSYKEHGYSTLEEHRTPNHRQYTQMKGWDADFFLNKAAVIGTYTRQYVEKVLHSRRFTEQTFNGCMGILRLAAKKEVGALRMEAACKRALQGENFNYKTIERILLARLDQLDDRNQGDLFPTPDHANVRGADQYK
jgi:transposase